jgi:hypothetical protein
MKTFSFEHHSAPWQNDLLTPVEERSSYSLGSALKRVGQTVLDWLTYSNNDPHIWVSHNNQGDTQWNAYDPISGRKIVRATEYEVMAWLEERYNYQ